ncbi:MAG: HRDC domain-containing protein [Actinomycetes bacterium]
MRLRPTTLQALSAVKGVGPAKLRLYGDPILALIARLTADPSD